MFCQQCGTAIPADGRFCGECGAAVGSAAAPVPRPPVPPSPTVPPPVWSVPPPPAQPPTYVPPAPPMQPPLPMPPPPGYGLPPQPPPAMYPPPGIAGYPPPAATPMPGGPVPPQMHWGVLLILTWFTGGLAGLIWSFKQAFFVKRLDPSSKAVVLLAVTLLGMLAQVAVVVLGMGASSMADAAAMFGIVMLLNLLIVVVALAAIFGMRKSIVQYYNTREPIGLKLSGVMTFFFSILYFQYHFSRIAEWKKTGRLG